MKISAFSKKLMAPPDIPLKHESSLTQKITALGANLFMHKEVVKRRKESPIKLKKINDKELGVVFHNGNMKNIYKIASSFLSDKQLSFLNLVFNKMIEVRFFEQSSVSIKSKSNKSVNEKYAALSNIDLLSHTINVVNKLLLFSSELSSQNKSILFYCALFHDFGKSKTLVQEIEKRYYGMYSVTENDNHCKMSALIFKQLCDFHDDKVFSSENENLIFYTIFYHHDYENKNDINTAIIGLINFLVKVDVDARKEEIAFVNIKKKGEQ
jgi:hypothetical protein